jgi:type I restriction enzyme M protein
VPKTEVAENGYDLSLNRYKQVVYEEVAHVPPKQILADLMELEKEIEAGLKELETMIS